MNFLKTIRNSIYSPQFYSTVLTKSFKSSLGYFLLLSLLLTIIRLTVSSPSLINIPQAIEEFTQNIISCYPKELDIKIASGQVSSNVEEPYFVSSCETDNKNLVVIDTKTPFSTTQFDTYQAAVWVTKDSVVYKRDNFETRAYSLTRIKDFKLNKAVLNSYQQIISPYLKFVIPLVLLLGFVSGYLLYTVRLIYLLFLSSIIWLLGKIFKQALSFGQSYKLGLHAITLGLIMDLVVSLTNRWTHFSGFPFMVSILTLGVVSVNLILPKKGQNS